MEHSDSGYDQEFIDLVELIYGTGFLSQGGPAAVDAMLTHIDLNNKKVLDIGSGLGGIDIYLAQKHNAHITGVDVEPKLITEAQKRLSQASSLKGTVTFALEAPTDYLKQFPDNSFDIVMSRETILHIPLKDMIKADGVAYNLVTQSEYLEILSAAGFTNIDMDNSTNETIQYCQEDCQKIAQLKDTIENRFGKEMYNYALSSWTTQKNVFENGELLIGTFTATK